MSDTIQPLIAKLETANFTGTLEIHIDRGKIVSAELRHWLANSEFENPIPIVETKNETQTRIEDDSVCESLDETRLPGEDDNPRQKDGRDNYPHKWVACHANSPK